jgi:hypothetical protein
MNLRNEVEKLQKTAGILKEAVVGQPQGLGTKPQTDTRPGDVKNYEKSQKQASGVQARAANINNVDEFTKTFEIWVKTLGLPPEKFNKSQLRSAVDKGLTNLGYK